MLLMRPRFLSLKNSLTAGILLRRLPFIAIGAAFCWSLYLGMDYLLTFIRDAGFAGEIISESLFSMIFSGLFFFLILSGIVTSLSSFYMSADIRFFLSKPIPLTCVLRLKLSEALLDSSWMVLVFMPPVFIAYGLRYDAPALYYGIVAAGLAMVILIAGGIGAAAAHLLTRLFPARRSRDAFLGIALLLFVVLYFIFRSSLPAGPGDPEEMLNSFMRFRSDSRLLPGYWMTEAVFPVLRGLRPGLSGLAVLVGCSVFSLLAASLAGRYLFLRNIGRLQPSADVPGRSPLSRCFPRRWAALFYKDAIIFFRDTGQWSQILVIAALIAIYLHNLRSIPFDLLLAITPFVREVMLLVNMLMSGLILTAVAARFLFPLVSLEGEAFWVIRTAPVPAARLLWSKLVYGSIPVTVLITALVLAADVIMDIQGPLHWASLATSLMLCVSVSGLGIGMGAIYPKFRHAGIASVSVSMGSMAFMVIAFALVMATLALETWIYYLWETGRGAHTFTVAMSVCALTLVILLNGAAFFLPMKIGAERLYKFT